VTHVSPRWRTARCARISLIAAIVVAATASATSAAVLTVRRAPGPEPGASRLKVGAASATSPSQITAERIKGWRRVPDLLVGSPVDLSRYAARRKGWQPPALRQKRTHKAGLDAIEAVDVLNGPPDTMKVAFIRIDFAADRGGDQSTGNGRFDLSRPGTAAPPIDRPPHHRQFYLDHLEALHRYYLAQSYDRTVVVGDVWPRTSDSAYSCTDMADFGPWTFSTSIYQPAVNMFRAMLFAADTQSVKVFHDRIPWDQYDRVVIIHAGSDLQSDANRDSPEDIPSFTITVSDSDVVLFPADTTGGRKGHPIDRAAIVPEHINQDRYYGAINGVLAHECGHLFFGFADLYNTETGFPVVGLWSLMDSGNNAGTIVSLSDGDLFATGLVPPSIDPWQRAATTDSLTVPVISYGDTTFVFRDVTFGDTLAFRNVERHPDVKRVPLSSDEYLLLENRWLAPTDVVELDQADSSRVILGPKKPDRFEYDALLPTRFTPDGKALPGCGVLVWHIDESVIPLTEQVFPCDTARANYDCGFNTNPRRLAISVVEADGLADLGDINSPDILGSGRDPWFLSNNPTLGDSTRPNMDTHIGTHAHIRLDFLDEPDSTMRVACFRTWQLPGWPRVFPSPPGGPQPLAIDVDGDRIQELVWAGGPAGTADSAAVFAVRGNGQGVLGPAPHLVVNVGHRPNPIVAAIQRDVGSVAGGPAVIAVSTLPDAGPATGAAGRIWLFDQFGAPVAGWPPLLPSQVTTPPVIASAFRDTFVYVGCQDGKVYALRPDGTIAAQSLVGLPGSISGRLAVCSEPPLPPSGDPVFAIAAGATDGSVTALFHAVSPALASMVPWSGWPIRVGTTGFTPDFLWLNFGGRNAASDGDCFNGALSLVVHDVDRLYAYCLSAAPVPGWGGVTGDTIVAGLGAGDPDGDGFPEVLTQSTSSRVSYWDVDGHPAPGWPRRGTLETFRTGSSPLAASLDGGGRTHTIALNASGIVEAFDARGKQADGWPLASGLGAKGSAVLADLDGDHYLELVVPDDHGLIYAYSLPTHEAALAGVSWPMLGGDPQRSSALPATRTPVASAPASGPLVRGTLKAYPNPARRKPVNFAYRMTEPGDVEFRILDTSGHQVASFTRRARQSDNVEVWDPGALPAGLYVARLRFKGTTSDEIETIPVGLLR
jgi:M6 family metalloprotease-like protein